MADSNSIANQLIQGQAFGFTPKQQKNLAQAQQQEALGNALMQEGLTPVSVNNRMMGNIAYKISPLEGLAKIADALTGSYEKSQAINNTYGALNPPAQDNVSGNNAGNNIAGSPQTQTSQQGGNMWMNPDGSPSNLSNYEIMQGNRAVTPAIEYMAKEGQNHLISNPLAQGTINGQEGMYPTNALINAASGAVTPPAPNAAPVPILQQLGIDPMSGGRMQPQQAQTPTSAPVSPVTPAPTTPSIPPINASALQPPSGTHAYGKTVLTPQQQAALDANKANKIAQDAVATTAQAKNATENAANLADAQKTFNVAASSLPRAFQRFETLRQAAPNASYGGGVSETEPEGFHLISPDWARNYAQTSLGVATEPKIAPANQVFEQATKQGIMAELGPQLQGLRGNKFLEGLATGASGLNLADPPAVKVNAIDGLQDQYISNLKSLAQQRRTYGDPNAPTDMDIARLVSQNAPQTSMISVVDPNGRLARIPAQHLPDLIQSGGQIR